jgi:hypothetical protein
MYPYLSVYLYLSGFAVASVIWGTSPPSSVYCNHRVRGGTEKFLNLIDGLQQLRGKILSPKELAASLVADV